MSEEERPPRQSAILAQASEKGFLTIADLTEHFGVTPQTIRRDVNALCAEGLLTRFHGGVGLAGDAGPQGTADQDTLRARREIARLLASLIPQKASLFLAGQPIAEAAAKALRRHARLDVVTNSLTAAQVLSRASHGVTIAGGRIAGAEGQVLGDSAAAFLGGYRLDYGIVSAAGIDFDGSLLARNPGEAQVTEAVMRNARTVILAVDRRAFGLAAPVKVGDLGNVDILVTDGPVPKAFRAAVDEAGTRTVHP